jgi:transcriptional regulator with XRE-family HTH domain
VANEIKRPVHQLLGELMTAEREAADLSRTRVAEACHVSRQLVHYWETGVRVPDGEALRLWFEAVGVPNWKRQRFIAVIQRLRSLSAKTPLETLDWSSVPPVWTDEDQTGLDRILDPACCHDRITFDLYGCNRPFLDRFPGLAPALPDAEQPASLIVWMFTDPLARKVIANWNLRARLMAAAFGTLAPGAVPQRRIDEIVQACQIEPVFLEMYRSTPTDDEVTNQRVVLWDPDREEFVTHLMRASIFKYPPRPWDQLVLQAPA